MFEQSLLETETQKNSKVLEQITSLNREDFGKAQHFCYLSALTASMKIQLVPPVLIRSFAEF